MTIATDTIDSIQHGRELLTAFGTELDRLATIYAGLDPSTMTQVDALQVFHQTADLLRSFRQSMLQPLLLMMTEMEHTAGMAGIIERPREGLMRTCNN